MLVVVTISALIMEPTSNQQAASGLVNDIVPFVLLGGEGEKNEQNFNRIAIKGMPSRLNRGHEGGVIADHGPKA